MKSKSIKASVRNAEKETWSKRVRKGDNSVDIQVEELYNTGYLVTINKDWRDKKGDYQCDCKKYYSETNPLAEEKPDPFDELAKTIVKE